MINDASKIEDAWLGIEVDESKLFNPMEFVVDGADRDDLLARIAWLMVRPEYFSFVCKYILNIQLLPFQSLILHEVWNRKFPMLIGSRGMGKSFILSVYPLLRALFMPRRKIVVVGAAFRQSKVLFEYMDTIWKNAPILRDLCGSNSGPRRDVDRCVMHINESTITCLPLGDGSKIRGQRANDIIADEFASIPRDIFENVVAGFAAVAASPSEKVRIKAQNKRSEELGVDAVVRQESLIEKSNQIILSGTAYYDFNHFADYWKRYKDIVTSGGNIAKLEEVFGGDVPPEFDWLPHCPMASWTTDRLVEPRPPFTLGYIIWNMVPALRQIVRVFSNGVCWKLALRLRRNRFSFPRERFRLSPCSRVPRIGNMCLG